MTLEQTETTLNIIGGTAVELIRANIVAANKVATGELYNSVNSRIEKDNFSLSIGVYAAPYFNNIVMGWKANGLSGDGSFLRNLIRWTLIKGIASNPIEAQRAAWAIREHIFKNGIPPVDLLKFVREKLISDINDEVKTAIRKDINANFKEILNKYQ
jgi:hypothetical protein